MEHATFAIEHGGDRALATQHGGRAEAGRQRSRWRMPLSSGRIAVQGPTAGAKSRSPLKVVSLAAQQNQVERRLDGVGRHGGRRRQGEIAFPALDHQAGLRQFGSSARPHQEGDVTSGGEQPRTEVTADRTGADHEDAHIPSFRIHQESRQWPRPR